GFQQRFISNSNTPTQQRFADGGKVPGTGDTDSVNASLTPGEFVVTKKAAKAIGYGQLEKMNRYATGGRVRMQEGGRLDRLVGAVRPSVDPKERQALQTYIQSSKTVNEQLRGLRPPEDSITDIANNINSAIGKKQLQ